MSSGIQTDAEITRTVTEIVAAELGRAAGGLSPDTDLQHTEGADSIKVLRMIAKIEQTFDVELEDSDVFGVSTIVDVVAVVQRAIAQERE